MNNLLKSKSLLVIITAFATVIVTLVSTGFFNNSFFDEEFPREITRCGSTLPVTCVTFRCEKSYIIPLPSDGPPPIPGGGSMSRTCSDGSTAIEIPVN